MESSVEFGAGPKVQRRARESGKAQVKRRRRRRRRRRRLIKWLLCCFLLCLRVAAQQRERGREERGERREERGERREERATLKVLCALTSKLSGSRGWGVGGGEREVRHFFKKNLRNDALLKIKSLKLHNSWRSFFFTAFYR